MSDALKQRIQLIAGCVVSALLVASGIALILSCVGIYRAGAFTLASISAAYARIAVLLWVTVAAVLVALVLRVALPVASAPRRSRPRPKAILSRLAARLPMDCDPAVWEEIDAERRLRRLLRAACIVLSILFSIPSASYLCNPAHYTQSYNEFVETACLWIAPAILASLGVWIAFSFAEDYSLRRELASVKRAMASGTPRSAAPREPAAQRRALLVVRIFIAVAALALIVVGIVNGGMTDVLSKAINICTECIGLG